MERIIDKNLAIIDENEKIIANILHDIKSPLYSIKIGLSTHLDTELNKDIFETTINIINYIENFLVNYNFKHGRFDSEPISCNIKEIIQSKLENYKYIFMERNIFIDLFSQNEDYTLSSIPIFISSIIGNIISNIAFHASENKHASINIYKKTNNIFVDFENKYNIESSNSSLGLEFCQNLAKYCKIELKFIKTKGEAKVSLKIPNLSC